MRSAGFHCSAFEVEDVEGVRCTVISAIVVASAASNRGWPASARRSVHFLVGDMQGYLNLKAYGEFAMQTGQRAGTSG